VLTDILQQLGNVIDDDDVATFNVCRSRLWDCVRRGMRRSSFSPHKRVSVVFTDVCGTGEGAVDDGGPRREFFTLGLEWLIDNVFVGSDSAGKFLSNCSSGKCCQHAEP